MLCAHWLPVISGAVHFCDAALTGRLPLPVALAASVPHNRTGIAPGLAQPEAAVC